MTLLEFACKSIQDELRHKVYVEQNVKPKSHPKIEVVFEVKDLPSNKIKGVHTPHLVCFDPNSGTILYLAEVEPTTAEWIVEDSQFYDKTRKFGDHCIELFEEYLIVNGFENLSTYQKGQILAQIASSEFQKYLP